MKKFKEFMNEVKGGGVNRSGKFKIGAKLTIKTKKGQESAVIVKATKDTGKYVVKTTAGKTKTLHWTEFDINESLNEKTSKADHIKGLKGWVETYKAMRKSGNVKGAKQTKANIDKVIKKQNLDPKEIYGKDPDDPRNRK